MADSIFTSNADVLVNPVNCRGVSGAGLAKLLASRFPKHQNIYEQVCKSGLLVPGRVFHLKLDGQIVVYFPTKDDWRGSSRMAWIEEGLSHLRETLHSSTKTLAFPALGCGLGSLDWQAVRGSICKAFPWQEDQARHILLYPPRR